MKFLHRNQNLGDRLLPQDRRSRSISLVINTCDRRARLEETLESLQRQSYDNFEVVVVNGPSVDGSDLLLRQYESRIKLATCEVRRLGVSRNIGIDHAAGEIVAFLDDDAVPESHWLEKLNAAYEMASTAAVGGYVFDIPLDRIEYRLCTCTRTGDANTDSSQPAERYLGRGADPFLYLAGCNMSYRRSVLIDIGGFNAGFIYGYDDVEVCARIVDAGYRIEVLENAIVQHYRADNSIRDHTQTIRDLYPFIHARAIFAMQSVRTAEGREEAIQSLKSFAQEWRDAAEQLRRQGNLQQAECDRFIQRIGDGLREGLKIGAKPRAIRHFKRRPPRFKSYRR